MALTNPNFSSFDVNIYCLMRQEIQLLSEKLQNGHIYIYIYNVKVFIQQVTQLHPRH
jgi:hypothetical protein